MQIKNKQTGEVFEVTGSVNKLVVCHSYIDANGVTSTIQFDDGSIENGEFEIVSE